MQKKWIYPEMFTFCLKISRILQKMLIPLNITPTQLLVLNILWQKEDLCIKEIQKSLELDSATLTGIIQRLTKNELTVRNQNPKDRREVRVLLTPRGRELKKTGLYIQNELNDKLSVSFSLSEWNNFFSMLTIMKQELSRK